MEEYKKYYDKNIKPNLEYGNFLVQPSFVNFWKSIKEAIFSATESEESIKEIAIDIYLSVLEVRNNLLQEDMSYEKKYIANKSDSNSEKFTDIQRDIMDYENRLRNCNNFLEANKDIEQKYHEEITRIEKIKKLEAKTAELKDKNDKLQLRNKKVKDNNDMLKDENNMLKAKITMLEENINLLQAKIDNYEAEIYRNQVNDWKRQ